MRIKCIKLLNFRNYEKLELKFNSKKNIIIGKNGMGKTNIIEAIYMLAFTRSFRASKDELTIKSGTDSLKIEGIIKDKVENKYNVILNESGKKVSINDNNIRRISDYLSRINIVLFNSEDLKLIKDSPSTRRKLIDIELSQFSNEYLKYLSRYQQLLKQRNSYLKTLYLNGNASRQYLDILTNELVKIGIIIKDIREQFINDINEYLPSIYYKISGINNLQVNYLSTFKNKDEDKILKFMKKNIDKDIILGSTYYGVHKDDIEFIFNGVNIKDFGSEGEQKNAIIAFKLAELELFKKKNILPILILDDLFSELDSEKINNIFNYIDDDIQVFITTTELTKVNKKIKNNCKIFKIMKDKIIERNVLNE